MRDLGGLRTRDGRRVRHGALARGGALDHVPDGYEDRGFWDRWQFVPEFGTVYYYLPFLEHFPGRAARVVQAIAGAPPGGVVVHCQGGRDRSGLVTLLTLSAVGVLPEEIAADYALSAREPEIDAVYEQRGTTVEAAVLEVLDGLVPERDLADVDIEALRERLLE